MSSTPYEIQYGEDGVVLQFLDMPADMVLLTPHFILYDITRRNIDGLRSGDVLLKLRGKPDSIRLADAQEEKPANASAYVTISKDGMTATMRLLPPQAAGTVPTTGEICKQIRDEYGVTHGLSPIAVEQALLEKQWYVPIEIAAGAPAENGANGKILYLFSTTHDRAPRELPDGSVDYKNLDLFSSVSEGDMLAQNVPPEPGVAGYTVAGKVLPPKPGREAIMPRGKNITLSEDGSAMFAGRDGRVDIVDGRVEVSDKFVHRGDLDMGVGNINFQGDVEISGNVISGLTIQATGTINIAGTVEGATLIAGSDIILQKGIQGIDKAYLQAGGNVISRFIERGRVEAGGNVHSDYIVHSNITCQGTVVLRGKRGRLIGGVTRAGKGVIVRSLGTPTGEKTIIEVGPTPELQKRQAELGEKASDLRAQIDKIDTMSRIYGRKEISPDKQEMWQKLDASKQSLQQNLDAVQEQLDEVKQQMDAMTGNAVHVYGEVYHDVKFNIDLAAYTVKETIQFATFRYRNGEISFSACEISERGD